MAKDDKNGGRVYLREWREHRDLSQAALAEMVETSESQISMLENGERGLTAKWARRLAAALETTPGSLIDYPPTSSPARVVNFWTGASAADREQLERVAEAMLGYKAN